ncbi:MAG: TonB-dependent receptor, partial [Flavobacteriaceae bacterium]|nr:TonB-dependent receptor [Flavobacteriaceae bacterium]
MKIYLTSFFLSIGMMIFSQELSISGKAVYNQNTPLDIAEVTLSIKDSIIRNELTQEDGSFTFSDLTQGSYTLQIKQIGIVLYSQNIDLTDNLDLGNIKTIQEKEIQSVVVTGQKKLLERKVDRLVFNVENSIAASGGDAVDALKITPGIRVENDNISMIGKSRMSVMIDDKLVQISGEDLVNYLKSISADNIKSIEVITTPPAKYDAEGNSGLINIQLKKAKENAWATTLRTTYTQATYPFLNHGVNFSYRKGKLSLLTDLSYRYGKTIYTNDIYYDYPEEDWFQYLKAKDKNNSLGALLNIQYA